MPDFYKTIKVTQPNLGGPLNESLVGAVQTSNGAPDAGKVVLLNASGQLDSTLGGGSQVSVNGTSIANPNFDGLPAAPAGDQNVTWAFSGSSVAAYVVQVNNSTPGILPHLLGTAGKIPIDQGNGTVAWADPLVQGLYAPGVNVNTANPGSTPINPVLIGAQGPGPGFALTNLSVDSLGNLLVTSSGGSGTQYVSGTTVTPATGTLALGQNASNVVLALKLDGSGNLDSNIQSAVFAAIPGNAVPPNTAWIAASDGTNLQGLLVESSTNKNLRVALYSGSSEVTLTGGSLNVNITDATTATPLSVQDLADVTAGTTTAPTKILIVGGKTADGTPAYDPIPLIAGGTAVSVSNIQNVSQGSTTSGQVGPLTQAAVSTSDPSYTTGQTDPLSLTLQGHLRTQDFAEANANGSTSVPNNALYVAAKGADGFLHGLSSSTNDGKLDVNASFSGSVAVSFIADRFQAGAITSTQTVVISTQGAASTVFNITGTWTGTIQFQLQLPDNSWTTATAYPVAVGGAGVTQTSVNGQWQLPCGGFQAFRVIGNTVASGSATASLEAGSGTFSSFVEQLSATNLNVTVGNTVTVSISGTPTVTANQGSPNSIGNAWFTKVTDGVNVFGTTTTHPFVTEDLSDGLVNSASQPTTALQVAGWDGTNLRALSTTSNGFLNVNASISGSFTPALTADRTSTGTITSTQSVTLNTQGTGTTIFNITGSWTGTIVFEASVDGVNFVTAKCTPKYPTTTPRVFQTTTNGQWDIPTGGLNMFRLRGNTVGSGTATVWIEGGAGVQDIQVFSPLATEFQAQAQITDGVNGPVAVKAASTVPVTTDPALVVSLSPNSAQFATSTTSNTLPGTNPQTIGTSASAVVNLNAARKEVTIINTGTTYIYLGLGQTPTNTAYHIALAKCTAANDGTGGTWTSDMWKGSVLALSSAAGGTVNLTELT
jgi:hypothetical protein